MAKGKQEVQENSYKAKALVNIKYDKTSYKIGDEFEIRESDVEELKNNGYAEVEDISIDSETTPPPVNPGDGQSGQEPGGNGGE